MKFANLREELNNAFNAQKVNENRFIVYAPFYFLNSDENMPLCIDFIDNECILFDMGVIQEILSEKNIDINSQKVQRILKDYNISFDGSNFILKCEERLLYKYISYYFQALTLLTNV